MKKIKRQMWGDMEVERKTGFKISEYTKRLVVPNP
jgi:hypothetical protein